MGLFWWIFPGSKTLVSFFFSKKKKKVKGLYITFSSENQPITYKYSWASRKAGGPVWGQCEGSGHAQQQKRNAASPPHVCAHVCSQLHTQGHVSHWQWLLALSSRHLESQPTGDGQRIGSPLWLFLYTLPQLAVTALYDLKSSGLALGRTLVSRVLVRVTAAFPLSPGKGDIVTLIHSLPKAPGIWLTGTAVVTKRHINRRGHHWSPQQENFNSKLEPKSDESWLWGRVVRARCLTGKNSRGLESSSVFTY